VVPILAKGREALVAVRGQEGGWDRGENEGHETELLFSPAYTAMTRRYSRESASRGKAGRCKKKSKTLLRVRTRFIAPSFVVGEEGVFFRSFFTLCGTLMRSLVCIFPHVS